METDWKITLADASIGAEERAAVDTVLRSGWLSMGPYTEQFEKAFADLLGVSDAVAVSNGTAALHLAACALGVGPGDEVICPTLTFVATAAAMRHAGARVRLADSSSLDDFSIDPAEVGRLTGRATRAVVVVHYGGHPVDVEAIATVARSEGLLVIEDAAHALGSEIDGRACGTIGDAGCFSFFPNKNMTTGEGGMVVFRDSAAAGRARQLRSHAMTTLTWDRHRGHASSYDVVGLGFNYRIDEIRAALGLVQLRRLGEFNEARRVLAQRYRRVLEDNERVLTPTFGSRGHSAAHLATVLLPSRVERERARERLHSRRIQSSVHYPAIHRFSHYAPGAETLERAEQIADRVLTLPLHPNMTENDVDEVCAVLRDESSGSSKRPERRAAAR